MRLFSALLVTAEALVWAQSCAADGCLRALEDVEATARNGTADCLSVLQTTSTPAAITVFHTLSVTRTSTTTRNTTVTPAPSSQSTASERARSPRAPADEPWHRWLAGRDALAHLGRSPQSGSPAYPTHTPSYASECGSAASYVSACSCLGVKPAVVTARAERTTSTVFVTAWRLSTTVRTRYANSTGWNATASARSQNLTGTAVSTVRSTPVSLSWTNSARATEQASIKASTASRSSGSGSAAAITSGTGGTATSGRLLAGAPFANSTSPATLRNSTTALPANQSRADSISTAPFANSTRLASLGTAYTRVSAGAGYTRASARPTGWYPFPNATAAASAPFANTTAPPRLANSTLPPFLNTTTARFLNTTTALFRNATTARYWNTTTPRFLNTSTPTSAPTSTATIDRTCGGTAPAFSLTISQRGGGPVDGRLLRQSGSSVVLVADAARSSRFSVGASGRLCAVDRRGVLGNAAVAIVETRRNGSSDASPLWFVDGALVANLTDLGYAELRCDEPGGGPLECAQGDMVNWMGCGLQVTISSGTEPEFEGIECRGAQLLMSGGGGGGGGGGGNGTLARTRTTGASASLPSGRSSAVGNDVSAATGFADVRRRQGWGVFMGPLFGFASEDADL